jgi:hypothetical protein
MQRTIADELQPGKGLLRANEPRASQNHDLPMQLKHSIAHYGE